MNRLAASLPAGTWNPCCCCPFSRLSDGTLTSLLGYLSAPELLVASAVCTRWNYCAEAPQLHACSCTAPCCASGCCAAPASGVGLSRLLATSTSPGGLRRVPTTVDTTELLLHEATHAATRLTELDLSGAKRADAEAVTTLVLRHARTLRRLVLDGVSCLTDEHVARMLPACTALRHLSLARCAALTDVSLAALPPACFARLTSLDVSSCFGMSGVGLARALDAAEDAQGPAGRLRVLLARGINPDGGDALLVSLSHHSGLQTLDLSHSDPFGIASASSPTAITDDGLASLAARAGGLRSLRLSGWSSLTDAGVAASLLSLPLLTTLDLSGCRYVGDEVAAAAAARACVTELRLAHTRLTDAGVAALAGGARRTWAVLDVTGCRRVSVPALSALTAAAMHDKGKNRPVLYLGGIPAVRAAVGTAQSRTVRSLTDLFGLHVDTRLA